MGLKRILFASCAVSGALVGFSQAATAQDAGGGGTIGEVVVTAEKRAQSVQDVPVAVTALTAENRENLGVISMEDYARIAPGIVYTNNDRLTIRGLGRMTNAIGTDPGAAAYNDGVFSNSMQFSTASPMYLARTEILRGPQGTLYGRNSVAGLINVISRDPSDEYEAELRGRIGNFGRHDLEGLVSGPITDNLQFLVGASVYQQSDGYVRNTGSGGDTGDQNRTYYEGQLKWEPTENLEMKFRIQAALWDDNYGVGNVLNEVISPYNTFTSDGNPATFNDSVFGPSGGGGNLYFNPTYTGVANGLVDGITNPSVADPYAIHANQDAIGTLHDNITTSFNLSWDLGGVNLKYITGWAGYKYYTTGVDADQTDQTGPFALNNLQSALGTPGFAATGISHDLLGDYHEAQEWFSNEINISSNGDGPLNWIAGVYQYHQDYSQDIGLRVVGDSFINNPVGYLRTPAPCPTAVCGAPGFFLQAGPLTGGNAPNPLGYVAESKGTLLVDSWAAFGQADWEFAPGLTATIGLRYSKDDKEGYDYARIIARTGTTAVTTVGVGNNFAGGSVLTAGQAVPILGAPNFDQAADLTIAAVCGGLLLLSNCTAVDPTIRESAIGGLERDREYSSDAVSGTAKLIWEPTNDLNFYASYSRGYKSGGWFGISTLAPGPYARPETVDAYELGAKMLLLDNLQANLSVYRNNISDMQVPFVSFNGTVSQTRLENVDSEVQGVEFEIQWFPFESLQLFANGAFTDAEITDAHGLLFVDPADPLALAPGARQQDNLLTTAAVEQTVVGNSNVNAPELKYAVGGLYTMHTDIGSLIFTGTYYHTDEQQYRPFANPIYTSPANDITNFSLIYQPDDERFKLTAYVKNAFDEVAYTFSDVYSYGDATHPIRQTVALNLPREAGVELQFHF